MTTTQNTAKIAKDQNTLVTAADIYADYAITQSAAMGSEVEYLVTTKAGQLISPATHEVLKADFAAAGIAVSDEPLASIFELKTGAQTEAAAMIAEMDSLSADFNARVEQFGFTVQQAGYLGHMTLNDAMAARLPSERADGLLEHFIQNGQEMCARQPLMTTSVHLSLSYADLDHAYQMSKILMVLTPVLTALCENTGGFFDGKACEFNPSAMIRLSQRDGRGGLSPVICAAEDSEDLIRRQASHLYNTPMMMHLDATGSMRVTNDAGQHPSLRDLQNVGLNTASNAMLSESMQYHMLKLTSLRNSFGQMTGKRLEVRMADNGPFQHNLMAHIGETIGLNADLRNDIIRDLTKLDLNPFTTETARTSVQALNSVATLRHGAMKVPMGNSTVGHIAARLLDFLDTGSNDIALARSTLKQGPAPTPIILAM